MNWQCWTWFILPNLFPVFVRWQIRMFAHWQYITTTMKWHYFSYPLNWKWFSILSLFNILNLMTNRDVSLEQINNISNVDLNFHYIFIYFPCFCFVQWQIRMFQISPGHTSNLLAIRGFLLLIFRTMTNVSDITSTHE